MMKSDSGQCNILARFLGVTVNICQQATKFVSIKKHNIYIYTYSVHTTIFLSRNGTKFSLDTKESNYLLGANIN